MIQIYTKYAKQIVSPFNIPTIFYNDVDNFVENLDKIPVAVICIPQLLQLVD